MGKYTYIGGDYLENIGGNKIVYVKGNNETHSNGQIIQTAEKGIRFGEPKDPPVIEGIKEIVNCVVHFRRCSDYMDLNKAERKGEVEPDTSKIYGFDWMRDEYEDNYGYFWDSKNRDVDGKSINIKSPSSNYTNLEKEYDPYKIVWNKQNYYTPWLSIYETQKARLRVTMDWDKKPSVLEWDKAFSHPELLKLPDASSIEIKKGKGMFSSYQDIIIECIAPITEEKEIRLLADGELAGKLKIVPNKKRTLKISWCLVDITSKNKKGQRKDIEVLKDKLSKQKLDRFVKHLGLSQALINVDATETYTELYMNDLGYDWKKYTQFLGYKYDGSGVINIGTLETDCQLEYEKKYPKDENHIILFLINNYFPTPEVNRPNKIITEVPGSKAVGKAFELGSKYLSLFQGLEEHTKTVVHEILHDLTLHHSFDKDAKHKFKSYSTENFMDYCNEANDTRGSLWKWQWEQLWNYLDTKK